MEQKTDFKVLQLALIASSPTNPRKTFNQAKLEELANSIASSGVHAPVLVRPLPASRMEDTFHDRQPGDPLPEYELVAGERRWRASKLAKAETIPAVIRELTDEQVIEIQIIENLQRDDLSPLEEAEGYQALCDATRIKKEEVAAKIGKSRTYVFSRLKLLDLCQEAKAAMREGQLDVSRAELIARIPDQKLQIKALKALTETHGDGSELRLSFRNAKLWLEQNVMLRLERAVFDIKAASIFGDSGSCTDCPKRTGANPDLFSDVDSPDVCTDPGCFHAKEEAHHDHMVAKARKSGMEVIEGEEAEKLMPSRHYINNYTKVEQHVHDPRTGGQTPLHMLLDELLPKAEVKAATKLIICPHTHAPIKVVPDEVAEKVNDLLDQTAAKSKTASKEDRARAKKHLQEDEDRKRRELVLKYEGEWRGRALAALKPALLAGAVTAFQPDVLRDLLKTIVETAWYEFDEFMALVLDLDEESELDEEEALKAIDALPDDQLGARICLMLAARDAKQLQVWQPNPNGTGQVRVPSPTATLVSLATSAGVDVQGIQAEVQDEMRAELHPPAARAGANSAAKPKKAKATKASKMSAEQAQQGIAAAMQNMGAASSGAAEEDEAEGAGA